MTRREQARIAAIWDGLSDAEKVAELRRPTGTRVATGSATKGDDVDPDELVIREIMKLRRLARGFTEKKHRASLVEDWLDGFRSRARRAGWPAKSVDIICFVVRDETLGWSGFGTKIYRDEAE
jgi:hypothetical protein